MIKEAMAVQEVSTGYMLTAAKPAVPTGYKNTDAGIIPAEWEVKRLGDIAGFRTGPFGSALHKSDYVEDGVPVINPMHIIDGQLVPTTNMSISEDAAKKLADFRLQLNDIVIGRRGDMGRCGVVRSAHSGWLCGTGSMIVKPTTKADPEFLQRILSSSAIIRKIESSSVGSTMINLNQATLSNLPVQCPTVEEQRAIATALSDVDALLEELDRLIAKKRDLKQAAMQQLLTGQTRLPGFEGEWTLLNMATHSSLKARIGWQGLTTSEYLKLGDYGLVTGTDFNSGRIEWHDCHFVEKTRYDQDKNIQVKEGDVLITKDGTIGKVAYIDHLPFPATLNSGVFVIRPLNDYYEPKYLYYVLMSQIFIGFLNKLAAGSTISHLYQKDFVTFEFLAAPTREEQLAIASVISAMDKELQALEQRHTKVMALKQAMVQELLTGRTRLVDAAGQEKSDRDKKTDRPAANVYFMRSVLAAEIVDQLHQEPTFGHVKFHKILFLVEHLCDVETGANYHRQAAGPYDNRALRSIDSQLRKQRWFDARKEGGRYRYVSLDRTGGHKSYFERYYASIKARFSEVIETFRSMDTERCEIVATLFSAWDDLLKEKEAVSDAMIVHEVLNHWHESKRRIPEDRWLSALGWMREKGFVPKGAV